MGGRPVNLLLVNYEYPPLGGGAANATYNIGKCLVGQGHRVTVLTAAFGELRGATEENGVCVVRIPAARSRTDRSNPGEMLAFVVSAAFRLPALLKKERFDGAIVFFALPCGPLGLLIRALSKTPYVISLRGGDVPGSDPRMKLWHQLLSPWRRWAYRKSLAVVANSESLKEQAMAADRHPVSVIPNGVDVDFFSPGAGVESQGPKRIMFAGRLQAQKNLPYLFEQVARLRNAVTVPFELHLMGDGPDREVLGRMAGELGIAAQLVWHGWLNDREQVRALYRSAAFLVNPSLGEGMSNGMLEAMSCGIPVLASRVVGNDALVRDGETGFLFDFREPSAFVEKARMLLENDPRARVMGDRARAWTAENASWAAASKAYADLFVCRS